MRGPRPRGSRASGLPGTARRQARPARASTLEKGVQTALASVREGASGPPETPKVEWVGGDGRRSPGQRALVSDQAKVAGNQHPALDEVAWMVATFEIRDVRPALLDVLWREAAADVPVGST